MDGFLSEIASFDPTIVWFSKWFPVKAQIQGICTERIKVTPSERRHFVMGDNSSGNIDKHGGFYPTILSMFYTQ